MMMSVAAGPTPRQRATGTGLVTRLLYTGQQKFLCETGTLIAPAYSLICQLLVVVPIGLDCICILRPAPAAAAAVPYAAL